MRIRLVSQVGRGKVKSERGGGRVLRVRRKGALRLRVASGVRRAGVCGSGSRLGLGGVLVSLAFHVVAVLVCFWLYRPEAPRTVVSSVEVKVGEPVEEEPVMEEPVMEEPPPEEPLQALEASCPVTAVSSVVSSVEVSGMVEPAMGELELPVMAEAQADFTEVRRMRLARTSCEVASLYAGRSGRGRRELGRRYGGGKSAEAERCVERALAWLCRTQASDGGWGPTQRPAMTALGLLAFLAHGEHEPTSRYGEVVMRAMRFLCEETERCGGVFGREETEPYVNGLVAYALSEAYGMTRLPSLRGAMERTLGRIVAGQQRGGGFDYGYRQGTRWDLSLSAWQYQALKAGHVAGAEVPGLWEALGKGVRFIRETTFKAGRQAGQGKFGYTKAGRGSDGMQGAGTLCLQLLGAGDCPEVQAGIRHIREVVVDVEDPKSGRLRWDDSWSLRDGTSSPVYGWYYCAQAAFHAGGRLWQEWQRRFVAMALVSQRPDGSWTAPGRVVRSGGWQSYDPWYTTSLMVLSLQVYCRYLPTYRLTPPQKRPEGEFARLDRMIGID